MHLAAFRALGLPHTYEALETSPDELALRVEALRRGDFAGLNVTVPHKARVLALVDDVDASAKAIGAANTLVRTNDGRVLAYNTDRPAIADELTRLAGSASRFVGGTGLILGTGGAAGAAIVALASSLSLGRLVIRGRSLGEPAAAKAYRLAMGRTLAAAGASPTLDVSGLERPEKEDARLVAIVQATSCGMTGAASGARVADAVDWASVPSDAVALDVVYAPTVTPFIERAKSRHLAVDNGLGMLAQQGARAFELWLGELPPVDVMLAAIKGPIG